MHSRAWRFNTWTALLVAGSAAFGALWSDPTSLPPKAPMMTLIEAVKRGDVAAARLLLDRGADPNVREVVLTKPSLADRNEGGKPTLADTVLMIAVQQGHIQLVKLLLRKGADVNGRGTAGFTPLIEAARRRRADLAKLLLGHGARPNQQSDDGDTALLFAANEGQTAMIDVLLDHGADINGGSGETPLAMAADTGWKDVVKLLISRGADVNLCRNGSMTPLECALIEGNQEVAALLRKAGGRSRPLATLRNESDQVVKEWEAERQAKARRGSRDRMLTEEDRQVTETVLLDLLSYKGPDLMFLGDRTSPDIILVNKTARALGPLADDQLNAELDDKQANEVSLEIREHLSQRNGEPISLAEFRPTNKHILLKSEDTVRSRFGVLGEKVAKARAWVQIYLPGYSKTHDRAVLRLRLGPSPHGAAGTYFLMKQGGVWHVAWRHIAFYV
jgi:ankyrin repeat protein